MEENTPKIVDHMDRRRYAAQSAFKISELWFKYASWLLTLAAIKLAAELTNSRLLSILVFILTIQFWSPIAHWIIGPNLKVEPQANWSNLLKILAQLLCLFAIGYIINMRLSVIVNEIVKTHIKG